MKYKIKDLSRGITDIEITVIVDFLGEGNKDRLGFGDSLFIPGYVKDETGEIRMTFWEEQARKVKPGKKIKITKGYVTEFRGEKQLNVAKEGSLEFIK